MRRATRLADGPGAPASEVRADAGRNTPPAVTQPRRRRQKDARTQPRRFPVLPECVAPAGIESCPYTMCRYHLAHRRHYEHRVSPNRDCAIAVANEGPHTVDDVAAVFGMTRERIRQIELDALEKLSASHDLRQLFEEID